jgi:hypothetical protein
LGARGVNTDFLYNLKPSIKVLKQSLKLAICQKTKAKTFHALSADVSFLFAGCHRMLVLGEDEMGKYTPLTQYLKRQSGNSVELTCERIQAIISPAKLPPSTRKYSDSLFLLTMVGWGKGD